jgi:C1A family cysteine protease
LLGSHAVLAVGYDFDVKIPGARADESTEGALIIKNSWGEAWGDRGFAFLPFHYVKKQLAVDFWTIFNHDWAPDRSFR